jgi:hypothetical protein
MLKGPVTQRSEVNRTINFSLLETMSSLWQQKQIWLPTDLAAHRTFENQTAIPVEKKRKYEKQKARALKLILTL